MSYPTNTSECLQHLFPNSIPETDWSVSIREGGVSTIDYWNDEVGTKPTESEVNAVKDAAKKTAKFKQIRAERNDILKDTDWMAGSDVTMSAAWKKYRKDLRDLPASNADPEKITFPTKPS